MTMVKISCNSIQAYVMQIGHKAYSFSGNVENVNTHIIINKQTLSNMYFTAYRSCIVDTQNVRKGSQSVWENVSQIFKAMNIYGIPCKVSLHVSINIGAFNLTQ